MTSEELLKVMRIRDFLSLILTYPMTLPNQHLLRHWRHRAHSLTAEYSQRSSSIQTSEEVANRCMNLLSEKPLKYLEVLIPNEILSKIEDGQTYIFHENDGSKGKQVVDDDVSSDHLIVREAIRKLAVDLAIDQLIQSLIHCDNIHHVRFITRNILERQDVIWDKIKDSLLGGTPNRQKINAKYFKVLWIDARNNRDNAYVRVRQEIARQLPRMREEEEEEEEEEDDNDDESLKSRIEEEMMKRGYLVFVVDGIGEGRLDPKKVVDFPEKTLNTVVVVTTEENDESIMSTDLEIRTEDHVLDDDASSDHLIVPEAMRKLAVDLAIDQVIQNLLHCDNIQHVRFFTRTFLEKKDVWGKMEVSLLGSKRNRQKINAKYFKVLWIDVPIYWDNADVRVRQEIARQLHLMREKEDDNDDESLKRRIEEEMMKRNYLVFVVDGIGKGRLDPKKVVGFLEKTLNTVVVVTTEKNDESIMSTDLEIRTKDHVLPWQLFCLNVGSFQDDEYLQGIAAKIVDKCRGHLLAIALVARSLKHEKNNDEPWENARKILHESSPDDMLAKAFTKIVLDGLNPEEKLCLACSLYMLKMEEKMATHSLVSSWAYYKIVSSQEKAELVLKNLVDRSVLFQMEGGYIQWPPEIYNVFKSWLQPSYGIRRGGFGLTEPPAIEEWVDAREIELMDNKISELPPSPNSQNLRKLFLQGNADLMEIPPSFFTKMSLLEVLNLSYTNIRSLPSSVFELKMITELRLQGCKRFKELSPEIKRLSNLTILDLQGTPIMYLPPDIEKLSLLQELKLSFYNYDQQRSEISPASMVSGPRLLRDLRIMVSLEDRRWDEIVANILEVTSKLPRSRMVISYIPQVQHLDPIISCAPPEAEAMFKRGRKRLKFVNGEEDIPEIIKKVLGNAGALYLDGHKSLKSLSEFEVHNLQKLQACIVGQCEKMETLIGEGLYSSNDKNPLPELKELCAYHMSNLTSVCEVKTSFKCYLTIMALHSCPKLTSVFTLSFLASLESLEELIVDNCRGVRTLVSRDDSSDSKTEDVCYLPNLTRVSLVHLPELENISNGFAIAPNLEGIGVYDCPQLRTLSNQELLLWQNRLMMIKAEEDWWEALIWGEEGRPVYMHRIFSPVNKDEDIMPQPLKYNSQPLQEDWVREVEYKLTKQQKGSGNLSGSIQSWQNGEDMFALLTRDLQRLLRLEKRLSLRFSRDEEFGEEVSGVYDEVDNLRAQYEEQRLWGWPLLRRSQLMHNTVSQLREKGLKNIIWLDAQQVEGHQISRDALIRIVSCFMENETKVIGVTGLWRATRVATMEYLQGNEDVQELFENVIFVEGLDVGDHLTIQNAIVDQLKIQVDGNLVRKIYETLENIKYLLILDVEYASIADLGRLGIPIHNNKGSKVIVPAKYSDFFRKGSDGYPYAMGWYTVIHMDEILKVPR